MKKYILGGIALLMIATVVAWNVNLDTKSNDLSVLSLVNIEMLAYGEHNENNHWTDWLEQGLTKDEYVKNVECTRTTGWEISLGFISFGDKTEYKGHKDICCEPGYANCTPTDCE